MAFDGLEPKPVPTAEPALEWLAPTDLLVDEAYQRGLGPKGEAQIRRIAEGWDWRRVKPVIVAWTERGFEIIDGQHTAIAAATRGIAHVPCMVVEAAAVIDRAAAFVGQNRDRLALTPMQMHHAAVAAEEPEAAAVEQVCARAGITLVRSYWGGYAYKPGDTIAVKAVADLVRTCGAQKAQAVLGVLAQALLAPITANHIKAARMLLDQPNYADRLEPLPTGGADMAIRQLGAAADKEARETMRAESWPFWKALGVVWFRKCKKRRDA